MVKIIEPRLTIRVDRHNVIFASRENNAKFDGKIENFDENSLERQTILLFATWVERAEAFTRLDQLRIFGHHLYRILFNDKIEKALESALLNVQELRERAPDLALRLELDLTQAPTLARLPWEYLYYPDGKCFLSTQAEIVLSRYISKDIGEPTLPKSDIKILIAFAKPRGLGTVLAEATVEHIEDYSKQINQQEEYVNKLSAKFSDELSSQSKYTVKMVSLKNATYSDFRRTLKDEQPDIVHFIGHGDYDYREKVGKIAFIDNANEQDWCREEDFADCFKTELKTPPRLVFLQVCEGAVVDLYEDLGGIVPKLLDEANVPAVVGMQYPIHNYSALDFCTAFYQELLAKNHVGWAIQKARQSTEKAHRREKNFVRDFGVPVLYMRSLDGFILGPPSTRAQQSWAPTQTSSSSAVVPDSAGAESLDAAPATTPPTTTDDASLALRIAMSRAARQTLDHIPDEAKRDNLKKEVHELLQESDMAVLRTKLANKVVACNLDHNSDADVFQAMLEAKAKPEGYDEQSNPRR